MRAGWFGHDTGAVAGEDLFLKCNRCDCSGTDTCIKIYKINEKTQLREAVQTLLRKKNTPTQTGQAFFNNEIDDMLKLTLIDFLHQKINRLEIVPGLQQSLF